MKIILCLAGFGLLLSTTGCLMEDRGGHGHDHDHDPSMRSWWVRRRW